MNYAHELLSDMLIDLEDRLGEIQHDYSIAKENYEEKLSVFKAHKKDIKSLKNALSKLGVKIP